MIWNATQVYSLNKLAASTLILTLEGIYKIITNSLTCILMLFSTQKKLLFLAWLNIYAYYVCVCEYFSLLTRNV